MQLLLNFFALFFLLAYLFSIFIFFLSFYFFRFFFSFFIFRFCGWDLSFSFVFDFLSFGFFSCVSFISGIVFFYSVFYMDGTLDLRRFGWIVFLFVFSMFLLVFSGNFFTTIVGWDGLGLVSFCLVIFYNNSSSLDSGLVTVFRNRVGDVFFLISFVFFFSCGNFSWDFFSYENFFIFLGLLFFGAITKSAQVPFSAWLPAAIAAPTPVSSLVHSSTLVTAGVYVLIRFNYLFFLLNFEVLKIFFIGTMIIAGICSLVERDLKKVVAMSTLRQLGIIMYILSLGVWVISFVHIIVHAFFKSMLFLSTGSLMRQVTGSQDSRVYGGFMMNFVSFIFFVVRCFCLSGFPFFLGFYSKDLIISSCSLREGLFFYFMFLVGCAITVMYRIRLIFVSYFQIFKYSVYRSSVEVLNFFLPVSFLFLKCLFLGGGLYWFFLFETVFFLSYFDLFMGILILVGGRIIFLFIQFFYIVFFIFSSILFLRWKVSGGFSGFFVYLKQGFYESTWIELSGGQGVFILLLNINNSLNIFSKIRVSILLYSLLFFTFYIF